MTDDNDPSNSFMRLLHELRRAELTTNAGRVNFVGMLLGAGLVVVLSATDVLDKIISLIKGQDSGVDLPQTLGIFFGFVLACVLMLLLAERGR